MAVCAHDAAEKPVLVQSETGRGGGVLYRRQWAQKFLYRQGVQVVRSTERFAVKRDTSSSN